MSITTIFDFTAPLDYTLNNISVTSAIASLALVSNPGQTFSQSLASSSGFTFNSSNTAIGSGSLSQINQQFVPTFTNLVNVSTGSGTVTKNAGGTAWNAGVTSVQSLSSSGFVQVTATINSTDQMVGLAKSNPGGNFTGIDYAIYFAGSTISIYQLGALIAASVTSYAPGDVFQVQVNGTTVNYIKNGAIFYTSLVAATFPLYFACAILTQGDIVSGILMQNGLSQYIGDTITFPAFNYSGLGALIGFSGFSTGGDTSSPGYILNGLYWNGTMWVSSNGSYAQSNPKSVVSANISTLPANNSVIVKVVTQSGNSQMVITGPLIVTYSGQIYPVSGGTVLTNSALSAQQLLDFTAVLSQSGSDSVTFALMVNTVLMYWNGSAWVPSDGTFSQTNSAAVIAANCSSLLTVNSLVKLYALLVSGNGSTTPSLTSMTLVYNFGQINPGAPATTIVYGFLCDVIGNPIVGAQITFSLVNIVGANAYMEAADHVLILSSVTATTDANGFFEQPVIATTQFEGTNTFIQVSFKKGTVTEDVGPDGGPLYITVPIQQSIDITTLLSA